MQDYTNGMNAFWNIKPVFLLFHLLQLNIKGWKCVHQN